MLISIYTVNGAYKAKLYIVAVYVNFQSVISKNYKWEQVNFVLATFQLQSTCTTCLCKDMIRAFLHTCNLYDWIESDFSSYVRVNKSDIIFMECVSDGLQHIKARY